MNFEDEGAHYHPAKEWSTEPPARVTSRRAAQQPTVVLIAVSRWESGLAIGSACIEQEYKRLRDSILGLYCMKRETVDGNLVNYEYLRQL